MIMNGQEKELISYCYEGMDRKEEKRSNSQRVAEPRKFRLAGHDALLAVFRTAVPIMSKIDCAIRFDCRRGAIAKTKRTTAQSKRNRPGKMLSKMLGVQGSMKKTL